MLCKDNISEMMDRPAHGRAAERRHGMISQADLLIGSIIHRVAQLIRTRIDEEVRPHGLTRLSWLAASHVDQAPGLTLSDLAARLELGNATTGKLIDRMVAAGWVDRRASDSDRRAQVLMPTAKGSGAVEELRPVGARLREHILVDLTAEERALLEALLMRIKARLDAMAE